MRNYNDVHTPYENAVRELLARLDEQSPLYSEALVYQQRLADNVASARRYGDTSARQSNRSEIIDGLNTVSMEAFGAPLLALNTSEGNAGADEGHGHGTEVRTTSTAGPIPLETKPLRDRLARYDDVELDALCMDYFPKVYDQFGRGMRRDQKINLLLEYCRRDATAAARLTQVLG